MKKRTIRIIYLTIILLSFLSCKRDKANHLESSKINKIDLLGNRYLELNRFSGTIVISKDGAIVYNKSFGWADYENKTAFSDNTAFKIGEITAYVATNIIDRLIKEEKIEPTHKLSNYLTDFKADITVGDALNHNANIDYNTLGKLIEQVSGKSYQENIEEYSHSLDLKNTYSKKSDSNIAVGYLYHNYRGKGLELQKSPVHEPQRAFGTKGLKSTAEDLVKILKSNPKHLDINGYLKEGGFSYSLVNDTSNNVSIIILSNRRQPVSKEISQSIEAILKNKKYRLPLARKPFSIDPNVLDNYSGKYVLNEHISFEVINTKDGLFVLLGPNKIALIPQSENQFYMEDNDASMRFEKDSSGTINSVRLLDGFIDSEQLALRIKS